MPRFSANLGYLWKELPLPEAVFAAHQAGFEAVEFHEPYNYPTEEIREVLEETSLKILGLNTRRGVPGSKDRGLAAVLGGRDLDQRLEDLAGGLHEPILVLEARPHSNIAPKQHNTKMAHGRCVKLGNAIRTPECPNTGPISGSNCGN